MKCRGLGTESRVRVDLAREDCVPWLGYPRTPTVAPRTVSMWNLGPPVCGRRDIPGRKRLPRSPLRTRRTASRRPAALPRPCAGPRTSRSPPPAGRPGRPYPRASGIGNGRAANPQAAGDRRSPVAGDRRSQVAGDRRSQVAGDRSLSSPLPGWGRCRPGWDRGRPGSSARRNGNSQVSGLHSRRIGRR
jgi:hypothetical protein